MDLTERSSHFEFRENWSRYAKLIDEDRVAAAMDNVRSLAGDLEGRTFLDIGSGSGLFSLSALWLGAARVVAVDIDENSVATTRSVLEAFGDPGRWEAHELSVFDIEEAGLPQFDVVYSWGVLHHTGDMWRAIRCASTKVADDGIFVLALYEKTPLCGAWKVEKRLYSRAPALVQAAVRGLYAGGYAIGILLTGRNPVAHIRNQRQRGMDGPHDLHDWMGGYPYESTGAGEVDRFMQKLGFDRTKHRPVNIHLGGVGGSGCSEYVYRKRSS